MSRQPLRHERSDVLRKDAERSIFRSVWKTRAHVGHVGARERCVTKTEVLLTRDDLFVVELPAECQRVRALHARRRLRLVTKRARQIELVADSRAKTLRVVDALRATIVALSVVREDCRDRVEWTGADAVVTCGEEVQYLRIETVQQVTDAAVELIVTS